MDNLDKTPTDKPPIRRKGGTSYLKFQIFPPPGEMDARGRRSVSTRKRTRTENDSSSSSSSSSSSLYMNLVLKYSFFKLITSLFQLL